MEIDQHTSTFAAEERSVILSGDLRVNGKGLFRVLSLKLTTRGEMEYAYLGEVATGLLWPHGPGLRLLGLGPLY